MSEEVKNNGLGEASSAGWDELVMTGNDPRRPLEDRIAYLRDLLNKYSTRKVAGTDDLVDEDLIEPTRQRLEELLKQQRGE